MLFRSALLACGLVCASVSGAMASVIFTFTQTAPTQSSVTGGTDAALARAVLVVSDEAYANGFSVIYRNDFALPGTVVPQAPAGLEALSIGVLNVYRPVNIGLGQFLALQWPGSGFYSQLNLTAAPGRLLSGSLYYNDSESDVRFTFDGTTDVSGAFNTDAPSAGRCNVTGSCTFTGVQTVTVPEPASLALFGAALVILGWVRRRA